MSAPPRRKGDGGSRRDLALFAFAGLAAPFVGGFGRNAAASGGSGVRLGVQTSSFRNVPRQPGSDAVETLLAAMTECGVRECELFAPAVEPTYGGHDPRHHAAMSSMSPQMMRRELRKWRLRTSMANFTAIGSRFQKAGIAVQAYNYSPDTTFSDEEIDRGFEMAKELGAELITASMTLDLAKRVAPFADKHRMVVALSGRCQTTDPNELASPADFAAALKLSPFFKVTVDIGQFTVGNVDPVAYIRDHHADITSVHLKDCQKNGGSSVEWGHGDAPIRDVLLLLKRERWPIRAYVEYEYRGQGTPVDEVKRCLTYAKQVLA
jgi:sugar phosphate isomerase/epimerase